LLSLGMGTVLGDISALGYDAVWDCVPASAVGARHRRDRVWIVATDPNQKGLRGGNLLGGIRRTEEQTEGRKTTFVGGEASGAKILAHTFGGGRQGQGQPVDTSHSTPGGEGEATEPVYGRVGNFWSVEPDVGRLANGVPNRSHRLKALGNAVVPQVVEIIGRAIMQAEAA